MPNIKTGNVTHNSACLAAESTRQVAEAAASTQTGVNNAWIAYYKTIRDSAFNNGLECAWAIEALRNLGVAKVNPLAP